MQDLIDKILFDWFSFQFQSIRAFLRRLWWPRPLFECIELWQRRKIHSTILFSQLRYRSSHRKWTFTFNCPCLVWHSDWHRAHDRVRYWLQTVFFYGMRLWFASGAVSGPAVHLISVWCSKRTPTASQIKTVLSAKIVSFLL